MNELEVRIYAANHEGHVIKVNPDWKNAQNLDEVYSEQPGIEIRTTKSNMNQHSASTSHEVARIELVVIEKMAVVKLLCADGEQLSFTCKLKEVTDG